MIVFSTSLMTPQIARSLRGMASSAFLIATTRGVCFLIKSWSNPRNRCARIVWNVVYVFVVVRDVGVWQPFLQTAQLLDLWWVELELVQFVDYCLAWLTYDISASLTAPQTGMILADAAWWDGLMCAAVMSLALPEAACLICYRASNIRFLTKSQQCALPQQMVIHSHSVVGLPICVCPLPQQLL